MHINFQCEKILPVIGSCGRGSEGFLTCKTGLKEPARGLDAI